MHMRIYHVVIDTSILCIVIAILAKYRDNRLIATFAQPYQKGIINKHSIGKAHTHAIAAWKEYEMRSKTGESIGC